MLTGMSLGLFLMRLFYLLGVLPLVHLLMIFGLFEVGMQRRVYFGPVLKLEVPLKLAALLFLAEVCYGFVTGVWEAELLVVRVLARCIGLAMVMRLMYIALSTLFILLFLMYYSFVGVSNLLLMFLRVSGIRDLLRLGGMGCCMSSWSVWPHFIPVIVGFFLIFMDFANGS